MSETTVTSDLEQSFNIFSELGLKNVGGDLKILSLLEISLSIEEPSGHSVSFRIVD